MRNKKNPNQTTIYLSNRELEILGFIMAEEGQHTIPAVIHDCIINFYKLQYFNKQYMRKGEDNIGKAPKENLTPEQICEKVGGKVGKSDNHTPVCILPITKNWSVIHEIPLTQPEEIEKYEKKST